MVAEHGHQVRVDRHPAGVAVGAVLEGAALARLAGIGPPTPGAELGRSYGFGRVDQDRSCPSGRPPVRRAGQAGSRSSSALAGDRQGPVAALGA